MKIGVMGTGGVGGYFGGLLARAGHDVTFVARGEHLGAIRANGLRVESTNDGTFTVAGNAVDDTSAAGVPGPGAFGGEDVPQPRGNPGYDPDGRARNHRDDPAERNR